MSLAVGRITYANCAPFFHHLRDAGFSGEVIEGVPSRLNQMLAEGTIDISPSSSFEYACNWRDYLLLPGQSISSIGPVNSVLLFSPVELSALDGVEISITGESATSINLLKILLKELAGCREVVCSKSEAGGETIVEQGGHALLIGDRALQASRQLPDGMKIYDLGALWYLLTGLPFVFALWIVRRDAAAAKANDLSCFVEQLTAARQKAFADLAQLARVAPERFWYGEAELQAYWRQMSYDLDALHLQGLEMFFTLCVKHQLLAELPEIHFLQN
jgi:chorismate dehydratase